MSSKRKIDLIDRAETGSVVKRERPDESTNDQLPNFYFTANANITSNQNLWKHQREAYQKVHDFIARNSSTSNLLLVVLPTGTGKSGLAHILPFGLKGRVLMITHNTDSCYQMMHSEDFLYRRRILNEGVPGPKVHVVQNQDDMIHLKENYSHNDLFIANIHKFDLVGKWKNSIGQFFQFIIIDEGHHIPAKTYNRVVINQLLTNSTNIVLLTATPNRRDKLPLNATVVYDYSMRRAVEEKLIKHPCLITYTPEYTVLNQDGRSVVRKITEAQTPQLKKKINSALLKSKEVRSQLLAMMIKLIEEKRRETQVHHQAIVVCKTQSQVDQVTMELNRNYFVYDKPIVALSYHCDLSSSQRLHVQQEMKSHRCDVVVHCGLLNEGHDCPTISITVILCKVEWIGKFSQVVGRSIRYLHDKSLIDNTSHIIMNHFFVGKLWDQYKSEAHISNRPTSLNNTNNPRENNQTKPARNNQRKRLSTNANNGRECRFTDNVEASNDESDNEEHDQLSPDRIHAAEITPKYWNYDSLLCNTASGKEVIMNTELIISRKYTSIPSIISRKNVQSPVAATISLYAQSSDGALSREEDNTVTICEHKDKSFGPSCSRCEYLPTDNLSCQHEIDIIIIHCRTCNKINKVPLY